MEINLWKIDVAFASRRIDWLLNIFWTFFVLVTESNQLQTDVFPGKEDDKRIDACTLRCYEKLTSGDDPDCCTCENFFDGLGAQILLKKSHRFYLDFLCPKKISQMEIW